MGGNTPPRGRIERNTASTAVMSGCGPMRGQRRGGGGGGATDFQVRVKRTDSVTYELGIKAEVWEKVNSDLFLASHPPTTSPKTKNEVTIQTAA